MNSRALAGLGAASGASLLAYAVRGRSSSLLAPSVYRGDRRRPAIALTFDDGPSESTPAILDILERYKVKSTFFQCGANVRRLPSTAWDVARAGHEIGNHTDTHPYFHFRSSAFMYQELSAAQSSIREITRQNPAYFRAPFGVRWFGLREAQMRLGLKGVMWTTIGVDWKSSESRIVSHLSKGAGNGAIFCLHDGRELRANPDVRPTIGAVRRIIPILMNEGFHFERVSEILCPTN